MTAITPERWQRAQALERAYWCPQQGWTARRAEEHARHEFYSGLLGIGNAQFDSVMDLGCGPMSLLLDRDDPGRQVRSYAVDPCRYDPEDEAAYAASGITRIYAPAETYAGPAVDEVWAYNLLQHVVDPAACVATAERHALRVVRWFEWTDTPVTDVHPHSITADWLRGRFGAGWRCTSDVRGTATTPAWAQRFVALVLERRG